ncbi:response regulator [Leeuwenhoekiella parthenopeia]|uniref:Response regulator n=1 Tax=Leeuwenhoekiella parthenopeia TaxID=2890320 RepID=A0ABS8GPM4_9FLAO|nr:response regulator [Leeuwenhoekiella parthenopeia]MCC4211884.1 response regulator [Leeuwenhoekiella parthenopeia]
MFKKVLIAEDLVWNTQRFEQQLLEAGVEEIVITEYCDDAYLRYIKALKDEKPFDLLIADLSFKQDHRQQNLYSGDELIAAIRKLEEPLKVIVFSMEERLQRIRLLFDDQKINAYVFKSRRSLEDMAEALNAVHHGQRYISPQVAAALGSRENLDIEEYDILLLEAIAKGLSNREISERFKERTIKPNGISSIEKRLSKLRTDFKATNATHLIAVVKDLGLI